jgi:hypothetical protein
MSFDAPTQEMMTQAYEDAIDQLSQSTVLNEATRLAMARAIVCMTRLGVRNPETVLRFAAFKGRTMLMGLDA